MEVRDLYNKNRIFSGKTINKGKRVPKGLYYLVVFAIIEDNGKFLIQKRANNKGGKWSFTSGHPIHGEDSITGLVREIKEELNLDIKKENIKLINTVIDDIRIVDIYHIKMSINESKIKLQQEEVEEYKIVTSDEIEKIIIDGNFHQKHASHYYTLKKIFNKSQVK